MLSFLVSNSVNLQFDHMYVLYPSLRFCITDLLMYVADLFSNLEIGLKRDA